MSSSVYPVHVDATLDPGLSRWLWLVKWFLAIPHYIVLAFLWIAFFLLSVVAFFAIVFTGRYPRAIFDFNVGVMRWSWRVAYYTYGALATDRYPPFTLYEVPDYPAHLTVDYPEHLSRGLALVKWWLLAIPQYLIVGFLAGSGAYVAWDTTTQGGNGWTWTWGGGLIGLLAIFAAVALLFTGRYPQQIFDLVLGFNRWCLRVSAYAALMTDEYPPFRLDLGGHDPSTGQMTVPSNPGPAAAASNPGPAAASGPPTSGPATSGQVPPAQRQPTQPPPAGAAPGTPPPAGGAPPTMSPPAGGGGVTWGAGRVIAVILAGLIFLVAGGLLAGGTTLAVADNGLRNDNGYLMAPTQTLTTSGYAISSSPFTIDTATSRDYVPQSLLGTMAVRANGGAQDIFIGVARSADASAYLAGVQHSTLVDFRDVNGRTVPVYSERAGGAPKVLPGKASGIWVAQASGSGQQQLTWQPQSGDWTVVVMNANGAQRVSADTSVGATVPALRGVIIGLLVAGGVLLILSVVIVVLAVTVGRRPTTPVPQQGASA